MCEAVATPRLSRKTSLSEENQTTCMLCHKLCDEDKSGFPFDSWNHLREKAIEWQGKNET